MLRPESRLEFLTSVLEELPVGVVVLDDQGRVVHFNRYEERLAHRKREKVLGLGFFEEVAPCMNVKDLAGIFRDNIGKRPFSTELEFSFPFPFLESPRDVIVRLRSFEAGGKHYGCLFVEDVSPQRTVDRMKETLSGLLIHDLKSPLLAALMSFDFLAASPSVAGDDELMEVIGEGKVSLQHLERMVLNLLDITRLDTGTFPLKRGEVELEGLLTAAVRQGNALGRLRKTDVQLDPTSEFHTVVIDGDLVRRSLDNLVDNAVRHAATPGRVVVRCFRDGPEIVFQVEDDGMGIPDEFKDQVFDKFAQVNLKGSGHGRNRGLGLTFVRFAAEAHGGSALVRDADPQGTVFELRFPHT
ncbi:MAG: PAS domain-containing protein [Myxococcales bacterium]|nr:PAS domain-containing protein [Myxococcales bacterium]